MPTRVSALLFLLLIRCILGWMSLSDYRLNEPVMVSGNVINIYRKGTDCIMVMKDFLINSGKICAVPVGVRMKVIGSFERRLIDSFDGKLWLVSKQIEALDERPEIQENRGLRQVMINNFRETLAATYQKFVPEPEAGLVAGVVLGDKKDIGQDFYDRMIKSGSIHIAVASGYNILLVGGAILALCFWWVKRPMAVVIALVGMIFYAALAGGEAPVKRAVWMAGLMYAAQVKGRKSLPAWILALTAWLMLMKQPSLMESVSFQLSIAASFGLIVVEPWLMKKISEMRAGDWPEAVRKTGLMTSLATLLMTMPIIGWHFGRMNFVGIVSNVLILPLIPPLMILGTGMLILPGVWAWPVYALAHWIVLVINFWGS